MFLSSGPIPSPRPPAHRQLGASLLLVILAGCAGPAPAPDTPPLQGARSYPVLRPGDPRIGTRRPSGTECYALQAFGPDGAARPPMADLVLEWGVRGGEEGALVTDRTAWGRQTDDSLTYDPVTLAPAREHLRVGDQHIRLRYRGAAVERMVQRGDSVAPFHAVTFDREVFAFNQRELLMRVVRLQAGDTLIIPLYSEIDALLELDTISLVPFAAPDRAPGQARIRFADPAIVAIVTVDTTTGRILEEEIRNRKRPGRFVRTLHACGGTN